jgi:hypothetical protein
MQVSPCVIVHQTGLVAFTASFPALPLAITNAPIPPQGCSGLRRQSGKDISKQGNGCAY